MSYRVVFMPEAEEDLKQLDRVVAERITTRISWLAQNFEAIAQEPLSGSLSGLFKLRVGSYRVLYSTDSGQRLITVHLAGHRRDIYK